MAQLKDLIVTGDARVVGDLYGQKIYTNGSEVAKKTDIPTITDTYSATSSDGMSGKAVASAISGKQNSLTTQTAYSAKGSATKVPQITTNTLGQVTGITEVTITQPTVNNGTLTIQKNGANVQTFTANQSGNVTANITVPTVTDTYSATSSDAMSGKAVASALSSFSGGPQNIKDGDGTGSVYTSGASKPTADYSFAEGYITQASGESSHAEGSRTISNGSASHAEGYGSLLDALDTTVHTVYNSTDKTIIIKGLVTTPYSKAIVNSYIAVGEAYLSASGGSIQSTNKISQIDEVYGDDARTIIYFERTPSSSITSSAVNAQVYLYLRGSLASGRGAHAEGDSTIATNSASHAEGLWTVASNSYAHAEGFGTVASYQYQHVEGKYNKPGSFLHIVGNGTDNDNRSNAHTLDSSGNAWFAGNIKVGGSSYNDTNAKNISELGVTTLTDENIYLYLLSQGLYEVRGTSEHNFYYDQSHYFTSAGNESAFLVIRGQYAQKYYTWFGSNRIYDGCCYGSDDRSSCETVITSANIQSYLNAAIQSALEARY